jgi:hypothetical protein
LGLDLSLHLKRIIDEPAGQVYSHNRVANYPKSSAPDRRGLLKATISILTYKIHATLVKVRELHASAEETAAAGLGHIGECVLNVSMAESATLSSSADS